MKENTVQMIVLHKAGKWYCKHPSSWQGWDVDRHRIDGRPIVKCPDKLWCVVNYRPECVEELTAPPAQLNGYERREEFVTMELGIPLTVPAEFFASDGDGDRTHQEFFAFYMPVYLKQEPYWKVCQWDVVVASLDAEPCTFRFPVKVAPPAVFSEFPEVHHLFPCSISSEKLFDYVWTRIAAVVDGKKNLKRDDYRNIHTLTVSRRFVYCEPQMRKRDVSGLRSRKPRYETYAEKEEWKTVLSIKASGKNYEGDGVPSMSAANYAELEAMVEEYVDGLLVLLDDSVILECPTCKGCGWMRKDTL